MVGAIISLDNQPLLKEARVLSIFCLPLFPFCHLVIFTVSLKRQSCVCCFFTVLVYTVGHPLGLTSQMQMFRPTPLYSQSCKPPDTGPQILQKIALLFVLPLAELTHLKLAARRYFCAEVTIQPISFCYTVI